MPLHPRPDGLVRPALDAVNDAIRRLMDEPADEDRAETYARLLVLWREVSDLSGTEVARAA